MPTRLGRIFRKINTLRTIAGPIDWQGGFHDSLEAAGHPPWSSTVIPIWTNVGATLEGWVVQGDTENRDALYGHSGTSQPHVSVPQQGPGFDHYQGGEVRFQLRN